MEIAFIILAAAGTAIAALFCVALYAVRSLHATPRPDLLDLYFITPYELCVPFGEISFQAEDGVRLRGWWLSRRDTRRVVVGLSGRDGSKDDLIGIGTGLWRAGFNVLLFDFRDRCQSAPARRSVGYYEARDARAAISYAKSRVPGAVTGLAGYSMGASVALLAAAGDDSIRAVMADSAFASLPGLIRETLRRWRLPAFVAQLADLLNRALYGYSLDELRPVERIGAVRGRILLIHGTADSLIAVSHAHALRKAAPPGTGLWLCEGAEHCGAYFAGRAAYIDRVVRFFDQTMPNTKRSRSAFVSRRK
jgi:uncharacterized protein